MTVSVPTELRLDGRELQMYPLRERDSEELNEWVRAAYVRQARLSFEPQERGTPECNEAVQRAMADALSLTWFRSPGAAMVFSSKRGLARVLLPGCKREHPDLTLDDLVAGLKTPAIVEEAEATFARINDLRIVRKAEVAKSEAGPT